jgi:dTDP-4-dehydrorhamnose reductase
MAAGRVAVTGARGRLGSAVLDSLRPPAFESLAWSRPEYDLDDETSAERLIRQYRPDVVIHCAAMTDVDACESYPDLAIRRNADAVYEMAMACSSNQVQMIVVSTAEVFGGRPADEIGHTERDRPQPVNVLGASKLAGEQAARRAFVRAGRSSDLRIIRTGSLFGSPGRDFPSELIELVDTREARHCRTLRIGCHIAQLHA